MAEYKPGSRQLVLLAAEYLKFQEEFGPFTPISRAEAAMADPQLVWTGTSGESQMLRNGYIERNDTYIYVLAAKNCLSPANTLSFTTLQSFDCPDCESTELRPEGCEKCEWSGSFAIDLERLTSDSSINLTSEEEIWNHRVTGGQA
jgi:hypothetical protein